MIYLIILGRFLQYFFPNLLILFVLTLLCSEDSLILSLGEKSRNCQLSANRETRRGHAQNDTARSESSNKRIPEGHISVFSTPYLMAREPGR